MPLSKRRTTRQIQHDDLLKTTQDSRCSCHDLSGAISLSISAGSGEEINASLQVCICPKCEWIHENDCLWLRQGTLFKSVQREKNDKWDRLMVPSQCHQGWWVVRQGSDLPRGSYHNKEICLGGDRQLRIRCVRRIPPRMKRRRRKRDQECLLE